MPFDASIEAAIELGSAGRRKKPEAGSEHETKKGDVTMKFMMIVKHKEGQGFPPKELFDAIGKMSEEAAKAGTMLGNGGLAPTAAGARVKLSNGKITVIDGPFTEAKEIIGGYAQFELKSKQEAVEGAVQFMELHKKYWPGWEGETEVRQMMGPEDCVPKS
ncbi:MAG: YciI family protein [Candidatus Acidiferrales bacterium]